MKVAITGVAGFIGSNLAARVLDEGHTVVGVDDFSYGSPANLKLIRGNKRFEFHELDLREEKSWERLDGTALVHLASQKIPRYSTAVRTLDDNSYLVKMATKSCIARGMHLLYASTSDIYGKNPNVPYHEESDSLLGPTSVKRWAYAISKIYGEQWIQAVHGEEGLTYTIMRFFGSYGPHQNITWWGGPQSVFIQNILEGKGIEVHGDGKQSRTFTYVEDTVEGIYRCLSDPKAKNQIFNIAGNPTEEISIHDLALLILELLDKRKEEVPISFIGYESFGKYEDVSRRVPSIDKIVSQLGFAPRFSLREGLRKTIAWQKARFNP